MQILKLNTNIVSLVRLKCLVRDKMRDETYKIMNFEQYKTRQRFPRIFCEPVNKTFRKGKKTENNSRIIGLIRNVLSLKYLFVLIYEYP